MKREWMKRKLLWVLLLLLAHCGLAQTFSMDGITDESCTAERIHQPEHPYLENTILSMEAVSQA